MTKRKFLGEFEQLVLLAVVRKDDEGYGLSIRREIEERTGRGVSIGAIYATLERLETKGYVSSRAGEATPERGARSRRYFGISDQGRAALRRSRNMLDSMWDGVDLDRSEDEGQEVA